MSDDKKSPAMVVDLGAALKKSIDEYTPRAGSPQWLEQRVNDMLADHEKRCQARIVELTQGLVEVRAERDNANTAREAEWKRANAAEAKVEELCRAWREQDWRVLDDAIAPRRGGGDG